MVRKCFCLSECSYLSYNWKNHSPGKFFLTILGWKLRNIFIQLPRDLMKENFFKDIFSASCPYFSFRSQLESTHLWPARGQVWVLVWFPWRPEGTAEFQSRTCCCSCDWACGCGCVWVTVRSCTCVCKCVRVTGTTLSLGSQHWSLLPPLLLILWHSHPRW